MRRHGSITQLQGTPILVVDALLNLPHTVFAGEDLDAKQRRCTDDELLAWFGDHHVGDAVSFVTSLEALLGKRLEPVLDFVLREELDEKTLQARVRLLAHVSRQNFAVNVVAVWPIAGAEILFDRNQRGS